MLLVSAFSNKVRWYHSRLICYSFCLQFECITQQSRIVTPSYCASGGPSPILLRSCESVKVLLTRNIARLSTDGEFSIEYTIGDNCKDRSDIVKFSIILA